MTDDLAEIRAELDLLRAKADIAEHTARYNQCWDDGLHAEWVRTWAEDGRFILPGAPDTVGHEALRRMIEAMVPAALVHLTMNPQISVRGDEATQTCPVVLATRDASRTPGTSRWVTAGRYYDDLRRIDGSWQFSQRRFEPDASLRGLPQWW